MVEKAFSLSHAPASKMLAVIYSLGPPLKASHTFSGTIWCSYSRPIDSTTIRMACVTVKPLQTVRGGGPSKSAVSHKSPDPRRIRCIGSGLATKSSL